MTKLVKTDSAVESASHEFSARLTKMLGVPEATNVPAVVRPRPTGPKLRLMAGGHIANLYGVRTVRGRTGKRYVVFEMDILTSITMPVLGLVDYVLPCERTLELVAVRSALESVGLRDEFVSGNGQVSCNKKITVTCVEKLTKTGNKFMSVQMKAYEDA